MATSTSASASSPASICPVGPPPAITTACSVIATPRPASRRSPAAHALRDSHYRRFWPRPATLRHYRGLAASPRVRYRLKVERSGQSSFSLIACHGADGLFQDHPVRDPEAARRLLCHPGVPPREGACPGLAA